MTALVFALVACASVFAQADTLTDSIDVTATIYTAGAAPQTESMSIQDLESDQNTGCTTLTGNLNPSPTGPGGSTEPSTQPTQQEWDLATFLSQCLTPPISIASISQVTVIEPNGQADLNSGAALSAQDLVLPSDFADPQSWPVFWDTGDNVIYERPSRNATDNSYADMITVSPGDNLQFDVFEGNETPATVTISTASASVARNTAVTLGASVPGSPSGESYTWNFDGAAASATSAQPIVKFPQQGVYDVTVEASGPVVGFGSIEITVGSQPVGTGTKTTPTGSVKSKGSVPGAGAGGHKHTSARPKSQPKPKPKPESKPKPKPEPKPATTTSATSSAPVTTTARGPGTGGGTSDAVTASTPSRPPAAETRPSSTVHAKTPTKELPLVTTPAPAIHKKPTGVHVQGRLLGVLVPVSGSSSLTRQLSRGSAPALNRPGGATNWAEFTAILAALALLALGAGRELRDVRSTG